MHHSKHGYHHSFSDIEASIKRFDDPQRTIWQKPDDVVKVLKLNSNDSIVDIGAGTGYFSLRMAKACLGCTVYAADVEPSMIEYLKEQSQKQGLSNHKAVLIPTNKAKLPAKVDLVLVVNTYHHIDDRIKYFHGLQKLLNPSGRIAIIDFTHDSPEGPPAEHRISKESLEAEMKKAGFTLNQDIDLLPYQYFLVFKKSE